MAGCGADESGQGQGLEFPVMSIRRLPLEWLAGLSRGTRLTMRREMLATVPWGIVAATLNPGICALVGRKALGMDDDVLALLAVCSSTGMLCAGFLVGFLNHIGKIHALKWIVAGVSVILLSIALTGGRGWSAHLFLVQVLLCQIGAGLLVTLRSSIWRLNYPEVHRGKIVVFFGLCLTITNSLTVFILTSAMDVFNLSYRGVFLIAGIVALAGAYLFSKIRVRHEAGVLKRLREGVVLLPRLRLLASLEVLKTDKRFRKFMSWQMLNGFATLLVETYLLIIILNDEFHCGWLMGGSAVAAVPFFVAGVSSLLFARLFDRYDIFTMRALGALIWFLSRATLFVGVLMGSLGMIFFSRVIAGIAGGCGRLNWGLGHMAFAKPEQDTLYMGVHVSLTGLRGILGPFVGYMLYQWHWYTLPGFGSQASYIIFVTAVAQLTCAVGFLHMKAKCVSHL